MGETNRAVLAECSNCGEAVTRCDYCGKAGYDYLKKVDQTLFGIGVGNCFTACIATITGVPLEEIPHFMALYPEGSNWWEPFKRWCIEQGFAPWYIKSDLTRDARDVFPGIPWIAGGPTPRGPHCVVYVGSELYHDPNPCREGLSKVEDAIYFLARDIRSTAKR